MGTLVATSRNYRSRKFPPRSRSVVSALRSNPLLLSFPRHTLLILQLQIFFATEFFWATGVGAFRVSILFLYIELFPNRKFFWSAVATQALVIAYWIACILTICLLCRPINFNWNKTIQGTCGNVKATELASAGFNMFVDILVVCLPLPMVWRLQMPLNKKIGVTSTFAFGLW